MFIFSSILLWMSTQILLFAEVFWLSKPKMEINNKYDDKNMKNQGAIHGQERNATFPFPESCPIFLERDRKAVLVRTGGKERERKGALAYIFLSFLYFNDNYFYLKNSSSGLKKA